MTFDKKLYMKDYNKEYRSENKEKLNQMCKDWRSSNKEKRKITDKIRHTKNINFLWEFKKSPCMDCGGQFHPSAMDFDHKDSSKKYKDVSSLKNNRQKLLEEIKKCDLVCANCHRIRTWRRKNNLSEKVNILKELGAIC